MLFREEVTGPEFIIGSWDSRVSIFNQGPRIYSGVKSQGPKVEMVTFEEITIFRDKNMRCFWIYQIKMKPHQCTAFACPINCFFMLLPFSWISKWSFKTLKREKKILAGELLWIHNPSSLCTPCWLQSKQECGWVPVTGMIQHNPAGNHPPNRMLFMAEQISIQMTNL